MFRSDEEAALQRADALQRELDESRVMIETLRRELSAAHVRLAIVEGQDADQLRREVARLSEELACSRDLLDASERERHRLAALVPSPPRRARRYANPAATRRSPPEWLVVAMGIFVLVTVAAIIAMY